MVQRLIDWRNPMRQTQRIAGIGSSLIVLGAAFIVYQIYLKQEQAKTSFTKAKEMGMTNSIEFYRTELTRQRNFHSGMWFWSRIVIFTPGPLIFMAGFAVAHPSLAKIIRVEESAILLLLVLAIPLNLKLAHKYQRQIKK